LIVAEVVTFKVVIEPGDVIVPLEMVTFVAVIFESVIVNAPIARIPAPFTVKVDVGRFVFAIASIVTVSPF
jgi:hypothetical protein